MLGQNKSPAPLGDGNRAAEISDQAQVNYNMEDIAEHVDMIHTLAFGCDGKLIVCAYGEDPETGKKIRSRAYHFQIGDRKGMTDCIVQLTQEQHRNVYIPLSVISHEVPTGKRGKGEDVTHVLGLVADFDDADAIRYRERLPRDADLVLETSPDRFQAFYLLEKPVTSTEAAPVAKALKGYCRCDHGTGDLAHVWRVNGTLNWPNKKKVTEGRSQTPQGITDAEAWSGTTTAFADLKEALIPDRAQGNARFSCYVYEQTKSAEHGVIADKIKALIANSAAFAEAWNHDRGLSDESLSTYDLSLCSIAARHGWSCDELVALIAAHRGFDDKSGRQDYLKRTVDKALEGVPVTYSRDELETIIEAMDPEDTDTLEDINQKIADSSLSRISQDVLHKKMKEKTGVTLSALRKDIGDERTELDSQELVERTIKRVGKDNLLYSLGCFWLWILRGVWKRSDDRTLKQHIHKVYDDAGQEYYKGSVDSILDLVKTETYRDGHQFDQKVDSINTLSGELYFEAGQWVQKAHEKLHYRTTQLPVQYDPDAQAPRFQQFLAEIFDGDADAETKALMVIQLIGYTLLSTCRLEKFALLIGGGANGKSVLLAVIEALLGREYTCAVQPDQLGNRFQRAHMQGKLANIVTEIAEGAEIADAQLKAIVSGELTTAEHKHKPSFDFHPIATCWFGTNHMPHTRDFSDALFRRAVVITFPNKFEGERCDPHLKEKLIAELPGVLNLSLTAIAGVFQRGGFTTCASNEEAKQRWRIEADQVAQYVEERCELTPAAMVKSSALYANYQDWAESAGVRRKVNRNNFVARLRRLGVESVRRSNARWLHGIRASDVSDVVFGVGYKSWK